MKNMFFVFMASLIFTSMAIAKDVKQGRKIASNASQPGFLKGVVNKNEFVKQIVAYAKKTAGKGAKCNKLDVVEDSSNGTVVVHGSCNINEPDNEYAVLFTINGVVYDGPEEYLHIENIKFDFAG